MLQGQIIDKDLIEAILMRNPKWLRNRKHIGSITWNDPTKELRYVSRLTVHGDRLVLQQRYAIRVNYTQAVSYGSYDGHWSDQDLIWVDVPCSIDDTL